MTDPTTLPIVFLDTETTGLDPAIHRVWEIALATAAGVEMVFQLPLSDQDLYNADPDAQQINGWATRSDPALQVPKAVGVQRLAAATQGMTIVGKNPAFDVTMLIATFRMMGPVPWSYRTLCVDQLGYGALISRQIPVGLPWASDEIATALGVDVTKFERHTALGDVHLCQAMWHACNHGRIHHPKATP